MSPHEVHRHPAYNPISRGLECRIHAGVGFVIPERDAVDSLVGLDVILEEHLEQACRQFREMARKEINKTFPRIPR